MFMQLNKLCERFAHWVGDRLPIKISERMSPESLTIFNVHSLSSLLPYEAYDPDTHLYMNKRSVGFILEAAPLTGASEETVTLLAQLLTDVLPPQADFHCLLWASPKIGDVLDHFEQQRDGQGETLEWLARQRTDFLKQGTLHSLSRQGSLLIRDFRLFLTISIPRTH